MAVSSGGEFVSKVLWTGSVFDHLRFFLASQVAYSEARFRFIGNACPTDQLAAVEEFSADHPGRMVDVIDISSDRMVRHGDAFDEMLASRDDGEFFCLIDPDVLARGPSPATFQAGLTDHQAVTLGREVWSDHDGFVFGRPHLAIYRRQALADTIRRWGVGFSSAGKDISAAGSNTGWPRGSRLPVSRP